MEKIATINDVSKSLGIPSSTLRYWDKEGLLRFDRNHENNYRQFSFQTMVDICNIMLLRELELPIHVLKQREELTLDSFNDIFAETKKSINLTIADLKNVLKKIEIREATLKKLSKLKQTEPTIIIKKLPAIYLFDFTNKQHVQKYLADPTCSVDIINTKNSNQISCGIFLTHSTSTLLRPADVNEKKYLHSLVWKNQKSNLDISTILKKNCLTNAQIGSVTFQYLTSIHEDEEYRDYFEMWLEIEC